MKDTNKDACTLPSQNRFFLFVKKLLSIFSTVLTLANSNRLDVFVAKIISKKQENSNRSDKLLLLTNRHSSRPIRHV